MAGWRMYMTIGLLVAVVSSGADRADAGCEGRPATVLRVLASDLRPFYYLGADGEPDGFEHRILQSFAEAHCRTLDVVWVDDFSTVFDLLLHGDGDVIASTVTITPERQARMDFSSPYFPVRVVLVEPADAATTGRRTLPGKRVATIRGTTYESSLQGIPDLEWVYVATEEQMYDAVAAGRADALATDSTNFLWLGREHPGLQVTESLTGKSFYGLVVRPGDALGPALDAHLETLLHDGRYWQYLEQAFGGLFATSIEELKHDFLSPSSVR